MPAKHRSDIMGEMTTPKAALMILTVLGLFQTAPCSAQDWSLRRDLRIDSAVIGRKEPPRPAPLYKAFHRMTRLAGMCMGRVDVGSLGAMRVKLKLDLK